MKIKEFQKELVKKGIDIALFLNIEFDVIEPNIKYFSDYFGIGALIIPKNKSPFLIVPEMEYEKAKRSKIKVYKKRKGKRLTEDLVEILKKRKIRCKHIGIDKSFITLNIFSAIKKTLKRPKTTDVFGICQCLNDSLRDAFLFRHNGWKLKFRFFS